MQLSDEDQSIRGLLAQFIASNGYAPSIEDLAIAADISPHDAEAALRRLHDAHALLLHPHCCAPWVVHPFALAPGSCWVETPARGYWANCLYCAFGIAAVLPGDATITTRLGGESVTAIYRIRNGELIDNDGIFHFPIPIAHWWDNVIYACSSFQPFTKESDIDGWCARHAIPRGATMAIPELRRFASDWYGNHLHHPWRKRSLDDIRALLDAHGLTGAFWAL